MGWLADLILRSGVAYRPRRWAIIVAGLGLAAALLVYCVTRNPLAGPHRGPAAAVGPPIVYLKIKASRRAKALSRQLPDALEVMVRSLEAGHPVPTAIAMVGREMPDPIGSEFGMAADEIAYGATLELSVGHMAERCRHPDIDLFAATIRLQERSGGNLTGLLKMNAHTVRERAKLRLKITAATAEGRISATILTAAPFCVLGILEVIQPNFYGGVIHEPAIHWGLALLGGLDAARQPRHAQDDRHEDLSRPSVLVQTIVTTFAVGLVGGRSRWPGLRRASPGRGRASAARERLAGAAQGALAPRAAPSPASPPACDGWAPWRARTRRSSRPCATS